MYFTENVCRATALYSHLRLLSASPCLLLVVTTSQPTNVSEPQSMACLLISEGLGILDRCW